MNFAVAFLIVFLTGYFLGEHAHFTARWRDAKRRRLVERLAAQDETETG